MYISLSPHVIIHTYVHMHVHTHIGLKSMAKIAVWWK